MRAIWKVTFGELLTKRMRKNKNTYILELLLKVITAGIQALV
jgi:hypothetical protein